MKHPSLYQLGLIARNGQNSEFAITAEQRDAQAEIKNGQAIKQSDVILPFYERRDMSVTGGTSGSEGGMTVGNDVPEIGAALRSALTLERLGARIWGGLRSDATFPKVDASVTAEWLSETATSNESTFTFGSLALAPKRVTAFIDVSWQLLIQQRSIEGFLRGELMGALATEIERIMMVGLGASNEPRGILNTTGIGSVVGGTDGAAPTYANICSLEESTAGYGGLNRYGWLVSPKVRRKLRQTFTNGTGSAPVWALDQAANLLGHPAGITRASPDNLTKGTSTGVCSSIIHGDFSELIMGFWGPGIYVSANPFGLHNNGLTRFVATAYFDGGVRQAGAFAAMKDALAA